MTKIKNQFLTCLILMALLVLGLPNFTYANLPPVNPSEIISFPTSDSDFASIEANVNRLELEITRAELLEAELCAFRNCDEFKACLAGALGGAISCGFGGLIFGLWGAVIAGGVCMVLLGSACSDEFRGACS